MCMCVYVYVCIYMCVWVYIYIYIYIYVGVWVCVFVYVCISHFLYLFIHWSSLVAQRVKHPPAIQETRVWSLGWEDPLGKEMATHSSFLAWKIPWTAELGGLQSIGSQRVRHDWATTAHAFIHWWTFGLLPCLGYYNNCAVNMGVSITFWISVLISQINTQNWNFWIIW